MTYVDLINLVVGTLLLCFFEIVLIIDIYDLMRNPFQAKLRRVILYQLLALLVVLLGVVYSVIYWQKIYEARFSEGLNLERSVVFCATYLIVYFYCIRVIC